MVGDGYGRGSRSCLSSIVMLLGGVLSSCLGHLSRMIVVRLIASLY
jgi:hypothetical protein